MPSWPAQNILLAAHAMGLGSCLIGFAVATLDEGDPGQAVPGDPGRRTGPRGDRPGLSRRNLSPGCRPEGVSPAYVRVAAVIPRGIPCSSFLRGEVHLWFAYPDEWEEQALIESARAILDAGEIARSERFHFPAHRRLFLASHLLLRTTLSRYADIPPGAWRFTANDHGKPRVAREAGRPAPSFNIAHTAGVAVAAVTNGREVGVDVENRDRRVQARRLADRFFAPAEAAELGKLPPAELPDRFFLHWTLKEAYIKALGRGFAQPLDSFTFRLTEGEAPPDRIFRRSSAGAAEVALRPRRTPAAHRRGGMRGGRWA